MSLIVRVSFKLTLTSW